MYHMMGYNHGWMSGGGWIWDIVGFLLAVVLILVIVLLVIRISSHSKKD